MRLILRLGMVVLMAVGLLTACSFPTGSSGQAVLGAESADPIVLPPDQVADVARTISPTANFETYVIVGVDLVLLTEDGVDEETVDPVLVVTITDPDGNLLFTGKANDTSVKGRFGVPTAVESVTLAVEGPGITARSVEIANPATLETISRTMTVVAEPPEALTRAIFGLPDTDGDGVPDLYDGAPDNPVVGFINAFPPRGGTLTVGYEDNFPGVGDADYNDFLVNLQFQVSTNDAGQITQITGTAKPRARAAGYDHEFGIVISFPGATGRLYLEVRDTQNPPELVGDPILLDTVEDQARIVIFPETKNAFDPPVGGDPQHNPSPDQNIYVGHDALFFILFDSPVDPLTVMDPPYDPYLLTERGYDVHLIGRSSLEGSENPDGSDGFIDSEGFPRGLLVPTDWAYPIEPSYLPVSDYVFPYVEVAYPDFRLWKADLQNGELDGLHNDWYLSPNDDYVVLPAPAP